MWGVCGDDLQGKGGRRVANGRGNGEAMLRMSVRPRDIELSSEWSVGDRGSRHEGGSAKAVIAIENFWVGGEQIGGLSELCVARAYYFMVNIMTYWWYAVNGGICRSVHRARDTMDKCSYWGSHFDSVGHRIFEKRRFLF